MDADGCQVNDRAGTGTRRYDVSVVLTAYNQSSLLRIALDLLARQDFTGLWELLVCDDGSDEDTLKVVKEAFEHSDVPVRYVWQKRRNDHRTRSRNNALRCADGKVIIFLDGDMAVSDDFVRAHFAAHTEEQTVVCGTRRWLFLSDIPEEHCIPFVAQALLKGELSSDSLYSDQWFQERYTDLGVPSLACVGANFSFTQASDPILFDEQFLGWGAEDQEIASRLAYRHNYKIQFCPSISGLHLDRGSRKTFSPVRVTTRFDVCCYVANVVRFHLLYPELDIQLACVNLGYFELDTDSDSWIRSSDSHFEKEHISRLMAQATEWFHRFGGGYIPGRIE